MRKQCAKCPWKIACDPHTIPDGYTEELHENLRDTIAEPAALNLGGTLRLMSCHESTPSEEIPCVGWLVNQLGPGNNIGLRLAAMSGRVDTDVELVGEQHECFEDTLPENR
jgi:hypothetical protein